MNNLILEMPMSQILNSMEDKLNGACNKQQLQRYAEAFSPWLGKYDKKYKKRYDGSLVEAKELDAMTSNTASKYVIAEGIALIISSEENMKSYIDSLKPQMRKLWREILLYGFVSHDKAKEILGVKSKIFSKSYSFYYYNDVTTWNKHEYGWWTTSQMRSKEKLSYGYRERVDFITVSNIVRSIFFPYLFPELKDIANGHETLPEGRWSTIDLETESLSAFNLFSGLFKQGEMPLKKKGITAADMKRVNKKLALTEFFPNDHNEYREFLRAFNYIGVLGINEHLKSKYKAKKILSYADTLLDLFKNFEKFNSYLPSLLYPHIKGMRQNQTQWGHHQRLCILMMEWLKEHSDCWVSISDIYLKIIELGSDGTTNINTAMVYNPHDEQNTTEMVNLYTLDIITGDMYTREFGITGLKSFAFILASLGMAEIAIRQDSVPTASSAKPATVPATSAADSLSVLYATLNAERISPFDSLEYLRLTPLGRYALGVDKTYEPPVIEQEAYFELDPERLIIRSLQDPNPYEQLLRDTAMPISRGRFQTSALSFLTNCHSREDVDGKINIFKQFIANELPPLWEQFFQSLLQHCHPLKEDKTTYKHYTLQPDNRDLIQLITTDPVLREIIIRAEGYRILVKIEDLRKFETQLKKHGYLL